MWVKKPVNMVTSWSLSRCNWLEKQDILEHKTPAYVNNCIATLTFGCDLQTTKPNQFISCEALANLLQGNAPKTINN